MDDYKTVSLLVIGDFMTTPITTQSAVDLSEIMEASEGRHATEHFLRHHPAEHASGLLHPA